jgi:putative ABC transport system substrate-binding protein
MGLKVLQSSRERKALEFECDNRAHGNEVPKTQFDCGSLSNNVALAVAAYCRASSAGQWVVFLRRSPWREPTAAYPISRSRHRLIVATGGTVSVVKAKPVVPSSIPIVFAMGGDPVTLGIVASLNRPGGNITGVSFLLNRLATKEVELLHELVPKAVVLGFLVNPKDPNAESDTRETQAAADALGLKLVVGKASTEGEIDSAFAAFAQQQVAALFVDTEPFFTDQRGKIVGLAAQHLLPAVYQVREFASAGGLVIYGTSITDANRQLGVYTGRVLQGIKPADLPVVQSTTFELIINLKTAKALGLDIPAKLLALANEVIE